MSTSQPVTFRLDAAEVAALDRMARLTRRSRATLIAGAVRSYIDHEQAFLDAVQEGLDAARRGDVVSHEVILQDSAERRQVARSKV